MLAQQCSHRQRFNARQQCPRVFGPREPSLIPTGHRGKLRTDDAINLKPKRYALQLSQRRHGKTTRQRAVARRTPREVGFEVPQQIGATFLGDATYLRQLTDLTPPLTDEYPQRLQPNAARVSLSDPRRRPRRWATVGITTAFAAA